MKRICLLMLALMLTLFAFADEVNPATSEAVVIAPMYTEVDLDDLGYGTFPAAFAFDALVEASEGLTLTNVTLYSEDIYDIVDIATLETGNAIILNDTEIAVESIAREDGLVLINGGSSEGGFTLKPEDENNCFVVSTESGFGSYTERGTADIPVDPACVFTDSSIPGGEPITATGSDIITAMAESENKDYTAYNTTIRVEDGIVVEINRVSTPAETAVPEITADVAVIQKYGNLILSVDGSSLFEQGYAYGDIVRVTVLDQTEDMPIVSNYTDVNDGEACMRITDPDDDGVQYVIIAINMGDFATSHGIAEKETIEEDPGYVWNMLVEEPVSVAISMSEAQGYLEEYELRQLAFIEEKGSLTDEQWANFRAVSTTGMGAGALYRSTSPIDDSLSRNHEADEALNNWGIAAIINLADNEEAMKAYPDYANSYYAQRNVLALGLSVDVASEDFEAGFLEAIRYMIDQEGPYLMHCTHGKDRTGFTCAVLECLMGSSLEEVYDDYMESYIDLYGLTEDQDAYALIQQGTVEQFLAKAFHTENLSEADLAASAEEYLKRIGATDTEITALKERLAKSYME